MALVIDREQISCFFKCRYDGLFLVKLSTKVSYSRVPSDLDRWRARSEGSSSGI